MKTGLFRIACTLAAVVFLIAGNFAAEFLHQIRTNALEHRLVTDITQSLLGSADPPPILALANAGLDLLVPDLAPLQRFGELIVMDAPSGTVFVPPPFSGVTGSASLQLRASLA